MDDETRILIDKIGIIVGISLVLLALVGEVLGWWDDVGLLMGAVGVVVGFVSAIDANGREAVMILRPMPEALATLDARQGRMLEAQDTIIEGQGQMVEGQGIMVERHGMMVERQGQMIATQDKMLKLQRGTLDVQEKAMTIQERVLARQHATVEALDRIGDILDERLDG